MGSKARESAEAMSLAFVLLDLQHLAIALLSRDIARFLKAMYGIIYYNLYAGIHVQKLCIHGQK